jgi:hypothetical protein
MGKRDQLYLMSSRDPQAVHATIDCPTEKVCKQSGLMHCWYAGSFIDKRVEAGGGEVNDLRDLAIGALNEYEHRTSNVQHRTSK